MTPEERGELAERMVPKACDLACRVRDADEEGIARFIAALDSQETAALLVVLAAMVPVDDRSAADLLDWTWTLERAAWRQDPLVVAHPGGRPVSEPCGTYAAYVRHQRRGEGVDPECRAAMQAYKRAHKTRQRGEAA